SVWALVNFRHPKGQPNAREGAERKRRAGRDQYSRALFECRSGESPQTRKRIHLIAAFCAIRTGTVCIRRADPLFLCITRTSLRNGRGRSSSHAVQLDPFPPTKEPIVSVALHASSISVG